MLKAVAILLAFEIAVLVPSALRAPSSCSSSTNTFRSPAWVKSTWAANKRRRRDPRVVLRRHIGERDRQQRAADAIADRVDLVLAGRLAR